MADVTSIEKFKSDLITKADTLALFNKLFLGSPVWLNKSLKLPNSDAVLFKGTKGTVMGKQTKFDRFSPKVILQTNVLVKFEKNGNLTTWIETSKLTGGYIE